MNAVTFAVSAVTVLLIRGEEPLQPASPLGVRRMVAEMLEGFRSYDIPALGSSSATLAG